MSCITVFLFSDVNVKFCFFRESKEKRILISKTHNNFIMRSMIKGVIPQQLNEISVFYLIIFTCKYILVVELGGNSSNEFLNKRKQYFPAYTTVLSGLLEWLNFLI